MSVSGDGGFLYACGELAAAKQENIPLTAVIVDDGGYGMIRYDQDLHGDPREGVDLRARTSWRSRPRSGSGRTASTGSASTSAWR